MARQLRRDLVDALGHDQHWSIGGLRQKVSHRTVETSRQHDALAFLRDEREGAVDVEHWPDVIREESGRGFGFVIRPEPLRLGRNQVDDARNRQVLVHARKYFSFGGVAIFGVIASYACGLVRAP